MRQRASLRRATAALLFIALFAACSSGTDNGGGGGDSSTLTEGETLGKIEHLPGGTPVPTDVRTLLTARCENGTLELNTSEEAIRAEMDCTRMLPQAIIERFIGQAVAISYEGERLLVANETVGTMELPAKNPRVSTSDATPGS